MKANETPEKIYKTTTYLDERKSGVVKWKDKPVAGAENIEYTRTDAFIEKACKFLSNDANIPLWEGYNDTFGCATELLIKNFKKYMKGE